MYHAEAEAVIGGGSSYFDIIFYSCLVSLLGRETLVYVVLMALKNGRNGKLNKLTTSNRLAQGAVFLWLSAMLPIKTESSASFTNIVE